jgi:hypothetical protein
MNECVWTMYEVMNIVRTRHEVNRFGMPLKKDIKGTCRLWILHAFCKNDFAHCSKGNMGGSFEKR